MTNSNSPEKTTIKIQTTEANATRWTTSAQRLGFRSRNDYLLSLLGNPRPPLAPTSSFNQDSTGSRNRWTWLPAGFLRYSSVNCNSMHFVKCHRVSLNDCLAIATTPQFLQRVCERVFHSMLYFAIIPMFLLEIISGNEEWKINHSLIILGLAVFSSLFFLGKTPFSMTIPKMALCPKRVASGKPFSCW